MQRFAFKRAQTSVLLRIEVVDTSGHALTGLSFSSAGLIVSTIADNEASATAYTQAGGTLETIPTLGTYSAPTATKCQFKEVDATNHPGLYELHLADARFALANAKSLFISLSGAASMGLNNVRVDLLDDDPYTAKPANFALFSLDTNGKVVLTDTAAAALVSSVNTAVAAQIATWFTNFINPGGGGRSGSF